MQEQKFRYARYDGRINELDLGISSAFMSLVSDNWRNHFKWAGKGEIPADGKEKLKYIMQKAQENGYLIRFWATPDRPGDFRNNVWAELKKEGVDLIGTDDLKVCSRCS
jgi:hypothetical protein